MEFDIGYYTLTNPTIEDVEEVEAHFQAILDEMVSEGEGETEEAKTVRGYLKECDELLEELVQND